MRNDSREGEHSREGHVAQFFRLFCVSPKSRIVPVTQFSIGGGRGGSSDHEDGRTDGRTEDDPNNWFSSVANDDEGRLRTDGRTHTRLACSLAPSFKEAPHALLSSVRPSVLRGYERKERGGGAPFCRGLGEEEKSNDLRDLRQGRKDCRDGDQMELNGVT